MGRGRASTQHAHSSFPIRSIIFNLLLLPVCELWYCPASETTQDLKSLRAHYTLQTVMASYSRKLLQSFRASKKKGGLGRDLEIWLNG